MGAGGRSPSWDFKVPAKQVVVGCGRTGGRLLHGEPCPALRSSLIAWGPFQQATAGSPPFMSPLLCFSIAIQRYLQAVQHAVDSRR